MIKRAVLDTNVCLDLFVFHDPRWTALLNALKNGSLEAVTRHDCRTEWQLVLHYPHLPLDSAGRIRSAAEFDTLITCLPPSALSSEQVRLPLCSDRDDQKFLELTRDARADFLITKDKALLKLARKTAKAGLFAVLGPDAWVRDFAMTEPEQTKR